MSDQQPAHYRLSPSSSKRWLNCPGSARTDLPDRDSEASREGTLAHAISHSHITGEELSLEHQLEVAEMEPADLIEMERHIKIYTDFVQELPGEKVYEQKLAHPHIDEFGGTIDCLRIDGDLLHVVDLKFGFGRVFAADNKQLLCYLCLARVLYPQAKRFAGTIVHPRIGDGIIETAEFTAQQVDNHLLAVAEASGDETLVAGDHCQWCPLLQGCDTAYAATVEVAGWDFEDISSNDDVERLLQIGKIYAVIKDLWNLSKEKMMELIQAGAVIPGFKVVQGLKNRTWKNEGVALSTLKRRYPKQIDHLIKLKTPAQVEKVVPKTVLEELELYHRPLGALRLKADNEDGESLGFDEFDE